jgi:hypothetical protein
MIGFFPEFYPDELLYSACARYANQVIYPNKHIAVKDLFGSRGLSAIVDFPTRIENLLSSIPNHNYTCDKQGLPLISNKSKRPSFYGIVRFAQLMTEKLSVRLIGIGFINLREYWFVLNTGVCWKIVQFFGNVKALLFFI